MAPRGRSLTWIPAFGRRSPGWHPAFAALLIGALFAGPGLAREKLVPVNQAQMKRTDQLGFKWDPTPQGELRDCSNDCFDGAMTLKVNGGSFAPRKQPHATAAQDEFVLEGQVGEISVVRRLRIDMATGAKRRISLELNLGSCETGYEIELGHDQDPAGHPVANSVSGQSAATANWLGAICPEWQLVLPNCPLGGRVVQMNIPFPAVRMAA